MKKLTSPASHQPTFAPPNIHPSNTRCKPSFLPKMSSSTKPTLASLQTQITELQAQHATLLARVESILAAAPAAPAAAEAPAKGKRGAKKEKKPRDPDAPKRAPTAFFAFSAAERAKTPDAKITSKVLGERWALLTPEQQAAFKPATPPASDAE